MVRRFQLFAIAVAALTILVAGTSQISAQNSSSLRGHVVDAQTHQPLAGVRTSVFAMHGTKALHSAFTNTDGSFKLDGLGPGSYRLELSKPGYRGLTIEGIGVRPNEIMIIAGSITLAAGSATQPNIAQAENTKCGNLVQPGVTADVYVVCAQTR